ncbi:hypothetical protein [Methylobacterium oxalidis]|uniref:Uncharacterized protein n=1 Tax=Methylobacterium oxalidis TaxID=944322 RepID=A0A512JB36_9HYPH|nr:hypothetical protein [Methylobacterium oxalidis]GEP07089.1 hypothetical protein MOX02_51270 [Methylobacterium oxalidis]GJE33983.1 hypothetical protein LDDCCGHA_4187 [Methylobacterium oxalidis]GLS66156.1 hypothetical protein GCM10007888_45380 [Methylobacterium oxalidis]
MSCSYSAFATPAEMQVLRSRKGYGKLLAAKLEFVRVRYELLVARTLFGLSGYALLRGEAEALRIRWLLPDVQLRLRDMRVVDLSITEVF